MYSTVNRELILAPVHTAANRTKLNEFYLLCRYCKRCHPFHLVYLGSLKSFKTQADIGHIIEVLNKNPDNLVAHFGTTGPWIPIYYDEGKQFPKAPKNHKEFHKLLLSQTKPLSVILNILELFYMKDILQNATTFAVFDTCGILQAEGNTNLYEKGCGCRDNILLYPMISVYPSGITHHSELTLHQNRLFFVSCGDPLSSGISGRSLLSIFEPNVWIFMLCSWAAVISYMIVLHRATENRTSNWSKVAYHCSAVFAAFVEQGGPIHSSVWERSTKSK